MQLDTCSLPFSKEVPFFLRCVKKNKKLAEIRETKSRHGKRKKICGARSHGKKKGLGWRKLLLHGKTMEREEEARLPPTVRLRGPPTRLKERLQGRPSYWLEIQHLFQINRH